MINMTSFDNFTDMELVLFFERHIREPCEINIGGNIHNIRDFYIRETRNNIHMARPLQFAGRSDRYFPARTARASQVNHSTV